MLRTPRLVARLLIVLLIAPILSPFIASIGITESFTYASERHTLSPNQLESVALDHTMTSFTITLASNTPITSEDSVAITLSSN